jgi:hypothetical protein
MQHHTRHFWTHLVLCSLEQEGGAAVFRGQILLSNFCHQSLAFSGFMVLSRQLGTLKKTRSNQDISDLQVGALERGIPSRERGIPTYFPSRS